MTSQQWVQDWLWLFRQLSGMIKVNSFSIRLLTVQPSTPHYLLCTVLRKTCVSCWMKDSSTGISGSQHGGFVLPGVKEPSRICWKGHQNRGMMKDSAAAWPGYHGPFLIFIAATVMIHWGTCLAETLLLARGENTAFILMVWQRQTQYTT